MNPSLTANTSFLHGSGKAALISDKVIYATLDSLALKQTRLPLRLLPVDCDNVADKTDKKSDKERTLVNGKTSPKRPSSKVKSGASHQRKSYTKCLVFSSTKSENEPIARTFDSANASIVKSEIDSRENTTRENVENSSSVAEESLIEDSRNNNSDDLTQTEQDFCDNFANDRCEKEKCSVERKDSSSSSDYEEMNAVTDYEASAFENTSSFVASNKTSSESATHERNISIVSKIAAKSESTDDLASREDVYENVFVESRSNENVRSITSDENDSVSSARQKKQKKRFTRNVLHYVPRHLVKHAKKKKKKLKKSYTLNSSVSSFKSLQTTPVPKIIQDSPTAKIRSLSRQELKDVIISSPTNFVHVASATNSTLIRDTAESSLEQVVITHQQICATLPLLVGKDDEGYKVGNENTERLKVAVEMSPTNDDVISNQPNGEDQSAIVSITDKNNQTHYAEIKNDFSRESQSQAKVLDCSQVVKTAIENQADLPEGETYEPVCEFSPQANLPQANYSFLWNGHRTKNFLNDKHDLNTPACHTSKENDESVDSEGYDDIGPSNFVAQTESDYDDVGLPTARSDVKEFTVNTEDDCEEIYDDVLPPGIRSDSTAVEEDDYLIPETASEEPSRKEQSVESRTISNGRARERDASSTIGRSGDQYLLATNNEYSSVDCDNHLSAEERDEMGVYDDVGLPPGEERVNSLYASSTPGSVLGLTSMNGKESEWEDLEEVSSVSHCPCQTNDPCEKEYDKQAASSKKKFSQRWSRNARRQRSRRSRRSIKATRKTITAPVDDSVSDDSTYESLYSCQPDDFSSDSETETCNGRSRHCHDALNDRVISNYLECPPMRPTPPPPREASLTQTLGRRIKMLRRTWSITKGSLGRIRRRPSVDESGFDDKESGNENHHVDTGKYFNFRLRNFRKSIATPPIFYLDGNDKNDNVRGARNNNNGIVKETIYTNSQYMGSGSDDSSRTPTGAEVDHYSVLADQEPLYQFYAAAVARVAFESDSEGYEEVEDATCKRESTVLAKSGQRMLWCHTPQVIHSGLLQRLTSEEKKIQEAKFEILTSEASYLNSLRVLENEFLNNSLMNEILSQNERKRLFGGVPNVLSTSQTFLAELEAVWRADPMLPGLSEVLLKHAEKCQATYVAYCSNQVSIDTTLKELKARKGVKFLEAVKRIEMRPTCQNLSLHSFLMLPMQRVTRLPLLADAILSKLSMDHSDRASWEQVLSTLSNVVAECNEGARAAAQEAEIEALARKLEYSSKVRPIVLRGKHLVRSGSVVQLSTKTDTEYKLTFGKKFSKTPLYLLLLTDYLLVTKLKSNAHDECYTVIDACKRNLLALESASEESPFSGRNAMILTLLENHSGRHVEYVLTCESNTERERWLEAVSPPKRESVGETLYESWDCPQVMAKYQYSPNQPDELSLQPGDVINVLRKMADGWYHGEKLLDGEQGWFPANHTKEVASEHVRARNLKQRHRLLALSSSVIQQRRAKQNQRVH
ncbi:uncharacterized protein LOC109863683 isoform X2 [Pseudomyrmex gracilis]|uniref:uncharacterized protein LOC109863683 isoform X2 n=1 Tax=Pseudomyrmex gracilis TaxID=219809 RepID=UPI000995AA90|nr:uncharacterized protein LOC109863683 isoform X2 [Pseudomyrmex gracilis]